MLAIAADTLPKGPEWSYEVKWDGYRALAFKVGTRVQLLSRNQKDLTHDYPDVVAAVKTIQTPSVVLDGEIVAIDPDGRPSFQALQHRSTGGRAIVYYAFDVLSVGNDSLVRQPLAARRQHLTHVLAGSEVLRSEPLPGSPAQIARAVQRLGLEGVIAKRQNSVYRPGERSDAWLKVKFHQRQEFVIGGYKPAGCAFDSILVGYYEGRRLYFAGRVRAGFTPRQRLELHAMIGRRPVSTCPFVNLPNSTARSRWGEGITAEGMNTLRWVQPTVVVDVAFVEWTREGLLRHARYAGARTDKRPREVHRESRERGETSA
jgi:bifunctional non-homologous end joining protein LigD